MKRGDLTTVALQGDFGKPRPAIVIQSDHLRETSGILVCPLTTTLRDASLYRLDLPANETTGLGQPSQIMLDKITPVRRDRCGTLIGRADDATLLTLGKMLAFIVGAAD